MTVKPLRHVAACQPHIRPAAILCDELDPKEEGPGHFMSARERIA